LTWAFHVDRPQRIVWSSLVTLAVVAVWLVIIARARRGYIEAYRRMIRPPRRQERIEGRRAAECTAALRVILQADAPARTRALRALARLQRLDPRLRCGRSSIEPHLSKEAGMVMCLTSALRSENVEPRPCLSPAARRRPRALLVRALEEKLDRALERIARLLALVYPPRDILASYRALCGDSPGAKAGALELLDNLVEGEAKRELMQALDEVALGAPHRARLGREASLARLLLVDDPWLRACAAFSARGAGLLGRRLDELAGSDPDPTVREAARAAPRLLESAEA
jgi:hypothetical protein